MPNHSPANLGLNCLVYTAFWDTDALSCFACTDSITLVAISLDILWGVICVKFHRHSVQAQYACMWGHNMHVQHEGTTCMHKCTTWGHNKHAQHACTMWGHNKRAQHACTMWGHNKHMHAQHDGTTWRHNMLDLDCWLLLACQGTQQTVLQLCPRYSVEIYRCTNASELITY